MHWCPTMNRLTWAYLVLLLPLSYAQQTAYFVITSPTSSTSWTASGRNVLSWVVSPDAPFNSFDVELARKGSGGILFAAKDVPNSPSSLTITLESVPAGTDYYVVLLNSTIGQILANSAQFTISSNSSSDTSSATQGQTVTVTGSPDPTVGFQATLGASNGALGARMSLSGLMGYLMWPVTVAGLGAIAGGLTVLS